MNPLRKTIPNEENDNISVFYLTNVNSALELNKTNDDTDFIYFQFAEVSDVYSAMNNPARPYSNFKPVGVEEIIHEQMHENLCSETPRTLNEWGCPFKFIISKP